MIEALCTRCDGTFIPHGIELAELIHGQTEAEEPCGGIGIVQGEWGINPSDFLLFPNTMKRFARAVTQFEAHGKADPHCSDEHCVWHHPPEPSPTLFYELLGQLRENK